MAAKMLHNNVSCKSVNNTSVMSDVIMCILPQNDNKDAVLIMLVCFSCYFKKRRNSYVMQ